MSTKKCKSCGLEKAHDEFDKILKAGPREPWNLRWCKDCAHINYMKRYATPARRMVLNASSRVWKQQNPERHAALARDYRRRHPEKVMAQNRLNYAIRKGIVQRKPCEVCSATDRVHAHHHSYAPEHWYDVRWLCFVCHKIEHAA